MTNKASPVGVGSGIEGLPYDRPAERDRARHDGHVREYLIRTTGTHGLPELPKDRLADVLLPAGFFCEPVSGSGGLRIRCGGALVDFSAEPVGWQVTVEGSMSEVECERLVNTLTQQIGYAVGESCEWLQIT